MAKKYKKKLEVRTTNFQAKMIIRQLQIDRFYTLLDEVIKKFPKRTLDTISTNDLPNQGVYFFFEPKENRQDDKYERVVRIGTHAVRSGAKATLYKRLKNHKGSADLTGNHRGSVFRKLIGCGIRSKDNLGLEFPHWGDTSKKTDKLIKSAEKPFEKIVSAYLHTLPFTILEVSGPSSKDNDRAMIEKNSIALLSNYKRAAIDECSKGWLGQYSDNSKIIGSGLWNSDHVNCPKIDNEYFDTFEKHLAKMQHWQGIDSLSD